MRWFLEEDDGEAESAKSEMMVASSVICDLTPHCFVICDRRDRGVDSVLYTVLLLHASKHGRKMSRPDFRDNNFPEKRSLCSPAPGLMLADEASS